MRTHHLGAKLSHIRTDEDTVELLRCLAVRCPDAVIAGCHAEHMVAFSCKRRGFFPSCGARRMAESAALLVDEVVPEQSVRQWVLSFPYPLRFLFARRPGIMGQVLGIVYLVIVTLLIKRAGFTRQSARTSAVTLIQRFGSARLAALVPRAQGQPDAVPRRVRPEQSAPCTGDAGEAGARRKTRSLR